MQHFKLTYATMFNPPEELHTRFEKALSEVKTSLGLEHGMMINGEDRLAAEKFTSTNPANTEEVLGIFQQGNAQDANDAIAAARAAFPAWSKTDYRERIRILRKVAELIDERIFKISAAMSLEVGKNRMEALGDTAETAELIRYACYQMEKNNGFIIEMGNDPLVGYTATNYSVLRPYGVWLVISPFNFPGALSGGPVGTALLAGNTVVMKSASDTPWTVRLLAECFRDAGVPDGAFNYVTGSGKIVGQTLIENEDVDGLTFTGSYEVGMGIHLGPVINEKAYQSFQDFTEELRQAGRIITGGEIITNGEYAKGYFCKPTIAVDVPIEHHLWQEEMFLPITMVHKVKNLEEAMTLANDVNYGLTSGFYGSKEEVQWYFDNIQAGVNYANRPHGATTGAWPGFQPFGGWKGSGSSGKNAGGHYYLQLYMREQIQTLVE